LRSQIIAAAAAGTLAAAATAAVVLSATPAPAAVMHHHDNSLTGGVWDEQAKHTGGAEAGTSEHFQVIAEPDGTFIQVSGTQGDATAIGQWHRTGRGQYIARFWDLNQNPPGDTNPADVDYADVTLKITVTGNTFVAQGSFTCVTRGGGSCGSGTAVNTGTRLDLR
jgi:hypothetical protein